MPILTLSHLSYTYEGERSPGGMGDEDDALSFVRQHPENLQNLVPCFGVEVAGGLVRQQNFRVIGQGAGDRHPLLLPAGKYRCFSGRRGV